jgi:hypothetical protein
VLELEDQALAGAEAGEGGLESAGDFLSPVGLLGVVSGAVFGQAVEELRAAVAGFGGLLFAAAGGAAQVVEADVHHHPVDPGGEARLEPEAAEGAVNLQERLLIKIARLIFRARQLQCQAKHVSLVEAHQLLKSQAVAALGPANDEPFVDRIGLRGSLRHWSGYLQATTVRDLNCLRASHMV